MKYMKYQYHYQNWGRRAHIYDNIYIYTSHFNIDLTGVPPDRPNNLGRLRHAVFRWLYLKHLGNLKAEYRILEIWNQQVIDEQWPPI